MRCYALSHITTSWDFAAMTSRVDYGSPLASRVRAPPPHVRDDTAWRTNSPSARTSAPTTPSTSSRLFRVHNRSIAAIKQEPAVVGQVLASVGVEASEDSEPETETSRAPDAAAPAPAAPAPLAPRMTPLPGPPPPTPAAPPTRLADHRQTNGPLLRGSSQALRPRPKW